jgi:rod shape-determining protein MreD
LNKIILRKIVVYSIYIVLALLLQLNYPDELKISGMTPDFLLVLAVLVAYLFGTYDGIAVGIIAGLLKDIYAGRVLGLGALLCLYCALIASVFLKNHLSSGILPAIFQVTAASVFYFAAITFLTYALYGQSYAFFMYLKIQMMDKILPGILLNVLSGFVIFVLFKAVSPFRKSKHPTSIDYNGGEQLSARI